MRLLICLILFSIQGVNAQLIDFKHYNTQNGLSSNYVSDVLEDSVGNIWVASDFGLDKITPSGIIIHYGHSVNDPYSLADDNVTDILEDNSGRIWTLTLRAGISYYDPQTDKFNLIQIDSSLNFEPKQRTTIEYDRKNNFLWLSDPLGYIDLDLPLDEPILFNSIPETTRGYLYSNSEQFFISTYDGDSTHFCEVVYEPTLSFDTLYTGKRFGYSNAHCYAFVDDKLIVPQHQKLAYFDFRNKTMQKIEHEGRKSTIFDIYHDLASSTTYIADWSGVKIFKDIFDEDKRTLTSLNQDLDSRKSLYKNESKKVFITKRNPNPFNSGKLIVGQVFGGVSIQEELDPISQYPYYEGFYKLLSPDVYDLQFDKNDNLWIGTDQGLNMITPELYTKHREVYFSFENNTSTRSNKNKNKIRSINYNQNSDELYFMYWGEMPDKINIKNINEFIVNTHPLRIRNKDGSRVDKANDFKRLADLEKEFADTRTPLISQKNGEKLNYNSAFVFNSFWNPESQNLWLGNWGGGPQKIDFGNDSLFSKGKEVSSNFPARLTNAVVETTNNCLLYSTTDSKGLIIGNSEQIDIKFTTYKEENGIANDQVNSIFVDSKRRIWVGTNTGLNFIELNTDCTISNTETFLTNISHIQSIEEDSNHNLWLSTNKGIYAWNPPDQNFPSGKIIYHSKDNVSQYFHFNSSSASKDKKTLAFGGNNGFVIIDTELLNEDFVDNNISDLENKIRVEVKSNDDNVDYYFLTSKFDEYLPSKVKNFEIFFPFNPGGIDSITIHDKNLLKAFKTRKLGENENKVKVNLNRFSVFDDLEFLIKVYPKEYRIIDSSENKFVKFKIIKKVPWYFRFASYIALLLIAASIYIRFRVEKLKRLAYQPDILFIGHRDDKSIFLPLKYIAGWEVKDSEIIFEFEKGAKIENFDFEAPQGNDDSDKLFFTVKKNELERSVENIQNNIRRYWLEES